MRSWLPRTRESTSLSFSYTHPIALRVFRSRPGLPARAAYLVAVGMLLLVLLDQPVLDGGGGLAGASGLLALDLDGHVLVLLKRGGEVGLLGGLGGLGLVEGQDLALGVVGLECWCLVGLEFFQVEFLDEVGCEEAAVLVSMRLREISRAAWVEGIDR